MTYCGDEDLVFENGKSIDTLFDVDTTSVEKKRLKEEVRLRCYNRINDDYLLGKTAVPARHIPALKNIEKDLVIATFLDGAYTMEGPNISEWARKYEDRAVDALEKLRFDSSADDVIPDVENVGNGLVSTITTNNETTRTETWILRARSATEFIVHGSKTGYLRNLIVGSRYPQRDWSFSMDDYGLNDKYRDDVRFENYPISLIIEAGATAFDVDDKFIFKTYAASYFKKHFNRIARA